MKAKKLFYWIFTILVSAGMLMSSYMYLSKNPAMIKEFHETLGYPLFFISFLGVAKLLGVIGLIQQTWRTLQEWAYAGFTFTFIGAAWTHHSTGTPVIFPLIALVFLFFSYILRK